VEIGGATPGYEHRRMAAAHAALLHGELDERYRAETLERARIGEGPAPRRLLPQW
jgi:hypothetical protein